MYANNCPQASAFSRTLLSGVCRCNQVATLRMAYGGAAYLWSVHHTHPAEHMVIFRYYGSAGVPLCQVHVGEGVRRTLI